MHRVENDQQQRGDFALRPAGRSQWRMLPTPKTNSRFGAGALAVLALTTAGLLFSPSPADGFQLAISELTLGESPSCSGCRITIVDEAVLGNRDGPGMLLSLTFVIARADNRYYVAEYDVDRAPIKIFDARGEYERTLGTVGQGPGEYLATNAVRIAPSGNILVFDGAQGRLVVFGPDHAARRTARLPMAPSFGPLVFGEQRVIFATPGRTPEAVGFPFHLIRLDSEDGEIVRSFGSHGEQLPGDDYRRRVGPAGDAEAFWAAYPSRVAHRVERWTISGALTKALVRPEGNWVQELAEASRREYGDALAHARPGVLAVQEGLGRDLWVFTQVPDERLPSLAELNDAGRYTVRGTYEMQFDTVVEVFDVDSGALLARTRSDHLLVPIDAAHAAHSIEGSDGDLQVAVVSLSLDR
jgi:hypothetical protein